MTETIFYLSISACAICWAYGGYQFGKSKKAESESWIEPKDKDHPYNYDDEDPQDWWKRDDGKAF